MLLDWQAISWTFGAVCGLVVLLKLSISRWSYLQKLLEDHLNKQVQGERQRRKTLESRLKQSQEPKEPTDSDSENRAA